jgi:Kdo2-lipid IVA lauroyltransferase/acyltransferase
MILLVWIMPFSILFVFSDLVYFLLYYIIKYRRDVVFANLSSAFPEKTEDEILFLTKRFYHHLCDISLESIKGFSMSKKQLIRRHRIINPEVADRYFENGMSAIAMPGHYNNWEWGSLSASLQIKHPVVALYKPMSNKLVDDYTKKHRAKFNTRLASIRNTVSLFNELSGKPNAYIMASDQSPTNLKDCFWIDFLNHDTPWLHGFEKYARKYNWPVMYVDIQKIKRGYYELELIVLTEDPASLPDGEITNLYVEHLKQTILADPAYWLWSHKRWKHKR